MAGRSIKDRADKAEERLRLRRAQLQLEAVERAYEAAQTSEYRSRASVDTRSGDAVMDVATYKLRSVARYLDENHDLAVAILNDLVDNVIGTGIKAIPMARTRDGELDEEANEQIAALYKDLMLDVTGELPWGEQQRLVARSLFRDGEVFIQHLRGPITGLRHLGPASYSQECIEADYCPFDLIDDQTTHGISKNAWGRPVAYWFYLEHPGDLQGFAGASFTSAKRVPAENITHLKLINRLRQTRGVPILAPIIVRLEDVKDYEESERIAARVAAAFSAVIKRSDQIPYSSSLARDDGSRAFEMAPGMVFDNLLPGESVEVIDSKRPNGQLGDFRRDMLRAASAGSRAKYSSVARDYDGSYSSQRQELVEAQHAYAGLRQYFIDRYVAVTHRELVQAARLDGRLRLPASTDPASIYEAAYQGPAMVWIDPEKEVKAIAQALEIDLTTLHSEIVKRGADPRQVAEQRTKEREARAAMQPETEPAEPETADDDTDDDEEAA